VLRGVTMRRTLLVGLGALIALVAAVAAISAGRTPDRPGDRQVLVDEAAGEAAGNGEPGSTVATFTAKDVDGRRVQVRRGKPGALFFFAGWCGSCLAEASTLGRVQRELGGRVAITAISPDPSDSIEAIRRFRRNAGTPGYAFVWDSAGTLGTQFAVRALDTTIIYGADGKVVFRDAAVTDAQTLREAFRKAGVR
jgi:thiol-disulfide isomerase/thioredoxin